MSTVAGLALQLAPWPRAWVDEAYLARWFPAWSRAAAAATGAVAPSLSGLVLGVLLTALVLAAAWALVAPRPGGPSGRGTGRPSPWRPFLTLAAWAVAEKGVKKRAKTACIRDFLEPK